MCEKAAHRPGPSLSLNLLKGLLINSPALWFRDLLVRPLNVALWVFRPQGAYLQTHISTPWLWSTHQAEAERASPCAIQPLSARVPEHHVHILPKEELSYLI